MNSKDRVFNTLKGKNTDGPPFTLTLGLYGARLTGCPLTQYYSDPVAFAKGQTAVLKKFHPDILFAPFVFALLGESFGGKIKYFTDQAPNLRRPAITDLEEFDSLIFPDPDTDTHLRYIRNTIREMVKEHSDSVVIGAVFPLPIDIPTLFMGMDNWMEIVLFNPDKIEKIMKKTIPFFVTIANRMFQAGASFIVSPCAFASPAMVTREMVQNFARPIMEKTLSQLTGPVILHHGGAEFIANLDLLTGFSSTIGYVVDGRDDLSHAREIIGPDQMLIGGPDNISISRLSAEEVENWCNKVLQDRRSDKHFILCNSGPDVLWNTPEENIHAFHRAIQRFRREA